MELRILYVIGLLCTFYLAETSPTLCPPAIRHCQSCMSPGSDTECSLEKEEQPDSFFLYSSPSSAMGTIMYVRSKSRTTPYLGFTTSSPLLPVSIHHSGGLWTFTLYTERLARLHHHGAAFVSEFCGCWNIQWYAFTLDLSRGDFFLCSAVHSPYFGELLANGTGGHWL
jgi:hypothetical protein